MPLCEPIHHDLLPEAGQCQEQRRLGARMGRVFGMEMSQRMALPLALVEAILYAFFSLLAKADKLREEEKSETDGDKYRGPPEEPFGIVFDII
ncbi:hypothetical protein K445DRAFT_315511 [Daldinia sp. EC12]|nr:hypothetical protein K445DRAFT_315511 [Daldinia sp. EC12]